MIDILTRAPCKGKALTLHLIPMFAILFLYFFALFVAYLIMKWMLTLIVDENSYLISLGEYTLLSVNSLCSEVNSQTMRNTLYSKYLLLY